jgi:hypothetical protein
MKNVSKIILLSLGLSNLASAMPCDTGYFCQSKSGKYQIEVERCRYVNDLHNLQVKISGKDVLGTLMANYDSLSLGGSLLAFEVKLPEAKYDGRKLTVEVVGQKGTITESIYKESPSPAKAIAQESISCKVTQ